MKKRSNISNNYSPNFSVLKRSKENIKYIIIHYTGMKNQNSAIKRLCDEKKKVSAHYFIKNNGDTLRLVPESYEAWHAGKSKWKKIKSLNKYSIGIEINNQGHSFKYNNFTAQQINSLKKLLKLLIKRYHINIENILGHSDIAPERKKDPGEKFPWRVLAKSKLSKWHNLNENKLKKLRLIKLNKLENRDFFNNLYRIGYQKINNLTYSSSKKFLIKAFQRHFRQSLINGNLDQECLMISKNLIK